jgi:glycosyltransferase involved in cell wall biosynthesis
VIRGDLVLLHNPAFLKLQPALGRRIVARDLIVVAHENFLRDGAEESFDVAGTLDRIDRESLALRKWIAPISANNRASVQAWISRNTLPPGWSVLEQDWSGVLDLPLTPPTDRPRDRRGRHSRPGFEKFPGLAALDLCFPPGAETNVLLGADHLIGREPERSHWRLLPFGAVEVADFLREIDFVVYFTAPTWHESFGLAIAEAIAAGKVVITDSRTAATFGDGVVVARPEEASGIVARMIADPALYRAQARRGQSRLAAFSAEACRSRVAGLLTEAAR